MARRATFLDLKRNRSTLLLDGGDVVPKATEKGRLQASYLLQAMAEMGYRTVALGPRDFAFGMGFLESMSQRTGITFTAANLAHLDSGPLSVPRSVVTSVGSSFWGLPVGSVDVGVVGVLDPSTPLFLPDDLSLRVTDPREAVEREVAKLRGSVDFIVILTHQSPDDAAKLSEIDGVDVIIISKLSRRPPDPVQQSGNAVLAWTHYQGRSVGWMDVVKDDGVVSGLGGLKLLSADVPDDKNMVELVERYKAELATITGPEPNQEGEEK